MESQQEGFFALVVEVRAHGYEFPRVVPFVVAREDVEGVELEELDACVEVAGRGGAGVGLAAREGRGREVGGYVEGGVGGGGEVGFELGLVEAL